jgi:hypothetical protein
MKGDILFRQQLTSLTPVTADLFRQEQVMAARLLIKKELSA